MSSESRRLSEELKRLSSQASPKNHAEIISTLVQEIANYVEAIKAERELVRQIDNLRILTKVKAETPEEEKQLAEDREALTLAKDAERHISEKLAYLSSLETAVQGLLTVIKRAR